MILLISSGQKKFIILIKLSIIDFSFLSLELINFIRHHVQITALFSHQNTFASYVGTLIVVLIMHGVENKTTRQDQLDQSKKLRQQKRSDGWTDCIGLVWIDQNQSLEMSYTHNKYNQRLKQQIRPCNYTHLTTINNIKINLHKYLCTLRSFKKCVIISLNKLILKDFMIFSLSFTLKCIEF